jgi:hypothetical protein
MPTEHILSLLIQERDRLNRAIEALQGPVRRRGRPPKNLTLTIAVAALKKRKAFSGTTRRKMAIAQKKRWAALKTVK